MTRSERSSPGYFFGQKYSRLEGARGIEPPPGLLDRANGFAARGVPSTIAPVTASRRPMSLTESGPNVAIWKKGREESLSAWP